MVYYITDERTNQRVPFNRTTCDHG
jgi:hypothetical protein